MLQVEIWGSCALCHATPPSEVPLNTHVECRESVVTVWLSQVSFLYQSSVPMIFLSASSSSSLQPKWKAMIY